MTGIVYLDSSKALDKLPHPRLLIKIKSHGKQIKILSATEATLTNGTQIVHINRNKIWLGTCFEGVTRGSLTILLLRCIERHLQVCQRY